LNAVKVIAFSQDGRTIAAASEHHINLFNGWPWACCQTIPFGGAHAVALSPDVQWLSGATQVGPELWDLANDARTFVLQLDRGVWRLSFSHDGTRLITDFGTLAVPSRCTAAPGMP
jgi:WD40 repeat protein